MGLAGKDSLCYQLLLWLTLSQVIVILGFGIAGVTVASLPSIAATYAVDSYKSITGYVLSATSIAKHVYGYGISEFGTPWVQRSGYLPLFLSNMGILVLWLILDGVFWIYG